METKTKLISKKKIETTPKIKKRGLVGAWKGQIEIIGDIDNVFNFSLPL